VKEKKCGTLLKFSRVLLTYPLEIMLVLQIKLYTSVNYVCLYFNFLNLNIKFC
jgi:hypothetical protein